MKLTAVLPVKESRGNRSSSAIAALKIQWHLMQLGVSYIDLKELIKYIETIKT